MTRHTELMRTVYFVRPAGKRGPIKIGCSLYPEIRLQQLQTYSRRGALEMAASVPGNMDNERRLHSLFWHDREEGEWFKWSKVLQLVVDAAARGELDIDALPPARVRRMPGMRRPWTEEQKANLRARRELNA